MNQYEADQALEAYLQRIIQEAIESISKAWAGGQATIGLMLTYPPATKANAYLNAATHIEHNILTTRMWIKQVQIRAVELAQLQKRIETSQAKEAKNTDK